MEHYKFYPLINLFICILSIGWLAMRVDTLSDAGIQNWCWPWLVSASVPSAPVSSVALQNMNGDDASAWHRRVGDELRAQPVRRRARRRSWRHRCCMRWAAKKALTGAAA